MRIVIDTNIFVGASIGAGASNAVLRPCFEHRFTPLMSAALLAQYEAVLGRDALFTNSRLIASERESLLDVFLSLCEWTKVYYLWRPNLSDESDNHLIELAVAGGAEFIITRNLRDLQSSLMLFPGLSAISPEAFLMEL